MGFWILQLVVKATTGCPTRLVMQELGFFCEMPCKKITAIIYYINHIFIHYIAKHLNTAPLHQ